MNLTKLSVALLLVIVNLGVGIDAKCVSGLCRAGTVSCGVVSNFFLGNIRREVELCQSRTVIYVAQLNNKAKTGQDTLILCMSLRWFGFKALQYILSIHMRVVKVQIFVEGKVVRKSSFLSGIDIYSH